MIKRLQVSWLIVLAIGLLHQDMAQCDSWAERLSDTNVFLYSEPKRARGMKLRDANGKSIDLSTFKGKLILLNFWNIDSVPCVMEKNILERIYREMKNDGVEVIAVNLVDNYHNVIPYVKRKGYTFTVACDPDNRHKIENRPTKESQSASFVVNPLSKPLYEVPALPTTYIIDPKGRIIGRAVGMVNWAQAPFRDFLIDLAPGNNTSGNSVRSKQGQPTPMTNKPRISRLIGPESSAKSKTDIKRKNDLKVKNKKDSKAISSVASSNNGRILLAQGPAVNQPHTVPEAEELPEAQPLTGSPGVAPKPARASTPPVSPEISDDSPSAHRLIPLPRALPYTPPGAATSNVAPQQPTHKRMSAPRVAPDEDGYVMATVPGSDPAPKTLKPGAGQGIGDYPVVNPAEKFILRAFEAPISSQTPDSGSREQGNQNNHQSTQSSPIGSITSGIRNVISNINPFQ